VLSFVLVAAIIGIVYMLTNTGTPPAANTVAETGASSGTSSGTATRQSAVLPEPKTESRTPIARAADRGQPDAPKAPPPGTAKAGAAHAAAGEAMSAKVGDLTVTLGPVCRARQPSADEKSAGGVVLLITVEVRNLGGTKKVEFLGWAPHGLARGAALIDNFGNAYDPRPVSRAAVPGEGPPTSIYPDGVAREVLAFEPPVPKIEFLSLKLPASVLGGKGDLRFKIPAAKITDQATTEAPPRDAANSGKRAKKPDRTRPGSEFGIPEGE
jgi:hypothetical protein